MLEVNALPQTPKQHTIYRPMGYHGKSGAFHRKFSYANYLEAHKWLDTIFFNGCTVNRDNLQSPSICEQCGGNCCKYAQLPNANNSAQLTEGKQLPLMAWNENIYFQDTEFADGPFGSVICHRVDGKNCQNKMLICKAHPFYPARIHLLEEECNYAIHLSSFAKERRLCTSIECEEWQLEELSLFYQWLYGEFPENRLIYILHSLAHFDGTSIPNEEVIEAMMKGSDVS